MYKFYTLAAVAALKDIIINTWGQQALDCNRAKILSQTEYIEIPIMQGNCWQVKAIKIKTAAWNKQDTSIFGSPFSVWYKMDLVYSPELNVLFWRESRTNDK